MFEASVVGWLQGHPLAKSRDSSLILKGEIADEIELELATNILFPDDV